MYRIENSETIMSILAYFFYHKGVYMTRDFIEAYAQWNDII